MAMFAACSTPKTHSEKQPDESRGVLYWYAGIFSLRLDSVPTLTSYNLS